MKGPPPGGPFSLTRKSPLTKKGRQWRPFDVSEGVRFDYGVVVESVKVRVLA
jgi:hypothetical protein